MKETAVNTICERASTYGLDTVSDTEVLALILHGGQQDDDQKVIERLIAAGGMAFLQERSIEELMAQGIDRMQAVRLKLIVEAGRRAANAARAPRPAIRMPMDAARLLEAEMANLPREELRAILLDIRNRVIRIIRIAEGGLSSSVISPRDLFRESVRANAAALILVHNHPSGDDTPSREDIETTKRFMEMGDMMGIRVMDHIVIAQNGWVSLKQLGLI